MKSWINALKTWSARPRVQRRADTFVPREWTEHFASLGPEARHTAVVAICRKVLDTVPLEDPALEPATQALATGADCATYVPPVRALLDRYEQEYESLLGEDEAKLTHEDEQVREACRRARAASALVNALEGNLAGMAYEAWMVLDDLGELRRLASAGA